LALSCVGSAAVANVRAAADISLLHASVFGVTNFSAVGCVPRLQVARLELGAEVTDHIGVTAGAALGETWAFYEFSLLPVSGRVYWDFTPNELWVRRTAYVAATYYHNSFIPDERDIEPFVSLGVGGTYTYYAVTARLELLMLPARTTGIGLLLGIEVGGSYIFGRHGPPD